MTEALLPREGLSAKPDEEWRQITGFPDYEVSSFGRVRRLTPARGTRAGRMLKPKMGNRGYPIVALCHPVGSGKPAEFHLIHRLVALNFIGPPSEPGMEVAHWDGDKSNAVLSNLRWATSKENKADTVRLGLRVGGPPGERHGKVKLTAEIVLFMRAERGRGRQIAPLARRFGVDFSTAYYAITGRTWKHLPNARHQRQA